MSSIQEMQQALIKQGFSPLQVSKMSAEELKAACGKKLRESLCGNIEGGNQDQFSKNLQYNLIFSQDGEKIKVAKVLTQTLPSGRKIEAFVDVAGNQYFQYRAEDDSILKEDYFKKAEKIGKLEKFQVQDGKLVALDMFGTPKTIYDGEQVFDTTMHNEWANKNPLYVTTKKIEDDKFRAHLNSLPTVSASYTDLMRSIEFKDASKAEQIDMLFENAGKRFYKASEQGNAGEMAKLLLDGITLACQKIDMKLGITQTKDFVKEYSGLNAIVDAINELVSDGDENNLTTLEKIWEALKGVGDVADSFIGTQGVATIGAIALATEGAIAAATAAGGAKLGQIVMLAIQAYFGYEGASLVVEGSGDIINAKTKEEARVGGAKVGMGSVMLYGTYKSFKAGYDAYKANKIKTQQEQQALIDGAKKILEIPEGTEITETVLKNAYKNAAQKTHPDKGGSTEAFQAVNDAYNLLKGGIKTPVSPTKAPTTVKASASKYSECLLPATMQNSSGNIGNVTVKIALGDLTRIKADALCVPEFPNCASEGGVGYAIMRSGAGKGLDKYGALAHAKNGGKGFDFGSAVITKSGGGNSPNLIHLVTAGAKADNQFAVVQQAVYNALKQAEAQGIKSVAMPALGTGIIGNLTNDQSAQAMMAGINQFNAEGGKIDVSLVVYGSQQGYNSFLTTLKTGSYTNVTPQQGAREFEPGRWFASMANDGAPVAEVAPTQVTTKPQSAVNSKANVEVNPLKQPITVTNVTGTVTSGNGSLTVTRPNGMQVDLFAGIPQEVLNAPAKNYMKFPDATTVPENFGVSLTQHASAPIEAQYIPTGKTVAETLELANKSGVPLKFDVQKQAFYQDAPYGGRQYVNTESITPVYTHEAEPNWGLAENYAQEYGHEVVTPDGPRTYAVDRAVVTANPRPTDNGLSANCAGKQYDIVYPDGTRKPYSPDLVKPGEPFQISKREGVELKMAVFDKPTTSAEGETLPAGKLMMIDADGHPYNGNPVKRLRSGEVEMQFDVTDPVQAKMKQTLNEIKELDAQTKAAKKAGNKDLANQHKAKADALAKELDTQLTEFVKAKQNPYGTRPATEKTTMAPYEQLHSDILNAAKNAKYDAKVVEKLLNSHPEVAEKLAKVKGSDGNALFSALDISDIFYYCSKTVENNPDKILKIFDDTSEINFIETCNSRGFGVFKILYY